MMLMMSTFMLLVGCCMEAQGSHVGDVAVEVERVVVVVEERPRVGLRMKERWPLWASACGRPPSWCSGVVVLSRNRRELLLDDMSLGAGDADARPGCTALSAGRKRRRR